MANGNLIKHTNPTENRYLVPGSSINGVQSQKPLSKNAPFIEGITTQSKQAPPKPAESKNPSEKNENPMKISKGKNLKIILPTATSSFKIVSVTPPPEKVSFADHHGHTPYFEIISVVKTAETADEDSDNEQVTDLVPSERTDILTPNGNSKHINLPTVIRPKCSSSNDSPKRIDLPSAVGHTLSFNNRPSCQVNVPRRERKTYEEQLEELTINIKNVVNGNKVTKQQLSAYMKRSVKAERNTNV